MFSGYCQQMFRCSVVAMYQRDWDTGKHGVTTKWTRLCMRRVYVKPRAHPFTLSWHYKVLIC